MATAERLLASKDAPLASLSPTATVLEAARLMNDRHVGSVLVIEKEKLVGIFTERDVMRRVVAEQRDPATTTLSAVMTTAVACGSMHSTLDELRAVMRLKHIRHVPIVDGNSVLGMISIGDLNEARIDTQIQTIKYLEQYMSPT